MHACVWAVGSSVAGKSCALGGCSDIGAVTSVPASLCSEGWCSRCMLACEQWGAAWQKEAMLGEAAVMLVQKACVASDGVADAHLNVSALAAKGLAWAALPAMHPPSCLFFLRFCAFFMHFVCLPAHLQQRGLAWAALAAAVVDPLHAHSPYKPARGASRWLHLFAHLQQGGLSGQRWQCGQQLHQLWWVPRNVRHVRLDGPGANISKGEGGRYVRQT
eukprot:1161348-Pelagomonas_calceolata.AAC.1